MARAETHRARSPAPPRAVLLLGAAVGFGSALAGAPACAQVMEIGPAGEVTTYAGPAVFSDAGVAPLAPPPSQAASPPHPRRGASAEDFRRAADRAELSADLIAAVAWRESRLRGDAVSPKGAVGEMQLMPSTARALGVDPADSAQNVRGGAAYLRALMRRYDGDLVRTLAAYNAGTAAVDRYGGVPPYRETQAYVAAVLDRLSQVVAPGATTKMARR